jgi:hypothetical protein
MLVNFFYLIQGKDLDIEVLWMIAFLIETRNDDFFKTQFFGLGYPLLYLILLPLSLHSGRSHQQNISGVVKAHLQKKKVKHR